MIIKKINSWNKLEEAVCAIGLLPYFKNNIPGFSVEENVPENLLWDVREGPWDWKGSVIRNFKAAYGKFFRNRAGYVALDCLSDFITLRRLSSNILLEEEARKVYNILLEHESLLSNEYKKICGCASQKQYRKSPNPFDCYSDFNTIQNDLKNQRKFSESKFETILTKLQMSGYVVIADFEYNYDKLGERYGWGIARYTTPEALYDYVPPENVSVDSLFERLFNRLRAFLPASDPRQIAKIITI